VNHVKKNFRYYSGKLPCSKVIKKQWGGCGLGRNRGKKKKKMRDKKGQTEKEIKKKKKKDKKKKKSRKTYLGKKSTKNQKNYSIKYTQHAQEHKIKKRNEQIGRDGPLKYIN